MKSIILALVMFTSLAGATGSKTFEPLERFPWDWGTECPFPWTEVDGYYRVESIDESKKMDGTYLKLESTDPESKEDNNILEVFQYDGMKVLQAVGLAVAKNSDRIITAYTRKVGEEKASSKIMIRTYVADTQVSTKDSATTCLQQQKVVTATFCSLYGRKCKETQNYVLVKVKNL